MVVLLVTDDLQHGVPDLLRRLGLPEGALVVRPAEPPTPTSEAVAADLEPDVEDADAWLAGIDLDAPDAWLAMQAAYRPPPVNRRSGMR